MNRACISLNRKSVEMCTFCQSLNMTVVDQSKMSEKDESCRLQNKKNEIMKS